MEDDSDEKLDGEPDALLPPYIPYRSFRSAVERLAISGRLPPRVDRSVLKWMPGGTQGHFLAALKSLSLIEKDSAAPTEQFHNLVEDKSARWNEVMPALLKVRYSKAALTALAKGTPSQVLEAMGAATKGTNAKAALFFVMAALDAGMEISPHLLERGKPIGFGRGKPKTKTRKVASPMAEAPSVLSSTPSPADPTTHIQAIRIGPQRSAELRWPADITVIEITELFEGLNAFKGFMEFQARARDDSRDVESEKDGAP
jgi:hypothetical protein